MGGVWILMDPATRDVHAPDHRENRPKSYANFTMEDVKI